MYQREDIPLPWSLSTEPKVWPLAYTAMPHVALGHKASFGGAPLQLAHLNHEEGFGAQRVLPKHHRYGGGLPSYWVISQSL